MSWHGLQREQCAEHGPRAVLCSCGFSRLRGPIELPPADHDEIALFRLWHRWCALEREVYDYWLALAKPFERQPLQAASLAARRVEEWRGAGVLDWLADGRTDSDDDSRSSIETDKEKSA